MAVKLIPKLITRTEVTVETKKKKTANYLLPLRY